MQRSKKLLIFLLLIGFLFGHLSRLFWPGTLLGRINPLDIIVIISIGWFIFIRKEWPIPARWLSAWLTLVAASFFIGISIFGFSGQPESLLFIIRLAVYGLFFGVTKEIFGKNNLTFIAYAGTLLAIIGIIQLKYWPSIPVSFIASHGFDPHSGRLLATFFDPNFVGSILLVTIMVTVYQLKQKYDHLGLLALLIQLGAVYLTQSRSAWLALIVAAFIFILAVDKKYLLLIVSFVLMAFLFSPSLANRIRSAVSLDDTSVARLDSWETAGLVINEAPITGVGYNNYASATTAINRYYPRLGYIALAANGSDSSLLTVFATTGIFGVLAWLIFMIMLAWPTGFGDESVLRVAIVGGLLVNSWFINSLLLVFVLFLMAVLVPSSINNRK